MATTTTNNGLWTLVSKTAIAGNLVFVFWILYNGINEGFAGTTIEKISYASLMTLLIVNAILLFKKSGQE